MASAPSQLTKNVAAAGVPEQVITTSTPCYAITFQAKPTNTGLAYVLTRGGAKAAPLFILGVPSGGPPVTSIPSYSVVSQAPGNGLDLSQFDIGVDVNGEGVNISFTKVA